MGKVDASTVTLVFNDSIKQIQFDEDVSRGRSFTDLKDHVRTYSEVLLELHAKYAVDDANKGMLKSEFVKCALALQLPDIGEGEAANQFFEVCGWPEDEDDKEELSRLRARPGHLAAALTRCANLVEMMSNGTAGSLAKSLRGLIENNAVKAGAQQATVDMVLKRDPVRDPVYFSAPKGFKGSQVQCFLEITIGKQPLGRLVVDLDTTNTPNTAYNFKCLCTGERGRGVLTDSPLTYRDCVFFRVIDGALQGGDINFNNGEGGESVYGGDFEDENLSGCMKHTAGVLSMANLGTSNTNNSQFFVTTKPQPHLDGDHVAFARVTAESMKLVSQLATVAANDDDQPLLPIQIVNCGVVAAAEV